ncbi:unnamed protein product, partial [Sphenostylis stenocarpa]
LHRPAQPFTMGPFTQVRQTPNSLSFTTSSSIAAFYTTNSVKLTKQAAQEGEGVEGFE